MGNRYMYGGMILPGFLPFLRSSLSVDVSKTEEKAAEFEVYPPQINHAFVEELGEELFSRRSFGKDERVHHSHGQTF